MAHLDTEAGSDLDSAAALIGDLNLDGPEEGDGEEHENSEPEGGEDELDLDADGDEEREDGEDEPDTPAIDAPVSLTAEEKAKFAGLPKEAQQMLADVEARRATQVQTATTKASEAQRNAEAAAARADAQAQARFAQQVKVFADAYAPQAPDPMLAQTNPGLWIAQKAQYDEAKAQHDDIMQQVESLGTDAESSLTQTEIAERDRELLAIPEVANEATREQFFSKAIGEGKKLGLDMSQFGNATAQELVALREIADLRDKAEKYDAATARQMQRVRDGKKAKPVKPNAAQPSSAEGRGVRESRDRLRQTGKVDDAAAALARMGF